MPVADDFNLQRIHVDGDELLHNLGRTLRGKQGFQEISREVVFIEPNCHPRVASCRAFQTAPLKFPGGLGISA